MKRENFYRRDPGASLAGMSSLSLEERGVYNTVIDLLYLTWRPLEDDRGYIAGHCRCAVQKLNPILNRLVEKGKLILFEEGGRPYISNQKFEDERTDVKGETDTRSGRKVTEKSAGVREKSGEVEEKSASVEKNVSLLGVVIEEKQPVTALDKTRVDKSRQSLSYERDHARTRSDFAIFWDAYPRKKGKGAAQQAYAAAIKRMSGSDPPVQLLAALERVKPTWREPKFIPHPATWLNQSRWEDEPDERADTNQAGRTHPSDFGRRRADANLAGAALYLDRLRGEGSGGPEFVDDRTLAGAPLLLLRG